MRKILLFVLVLLASCSKDPIDFVYPPIVSECDLDKLPTLNYLGTSSSLFDIDHPRESLGINDGFNYGSSYVTVDYNNDGYLDVVGFQTDFSNFIDREDGYTGYERKNPIKFFLSDCNGNLIEDPVNSGRMLGLVHGRKILLGDYNNDSYVDFFLVGHGYDRSPYPGEYPKVLLSSSTGEYSEQEFTEYVSFYHGGASGDFDNDGDLDVFLVDAGRGKSLIMVNNNGTFTPSLDLVDQSLFESMFNTEMFDVNQDGFLDIVVGGHDYTYGSSTYDNTTKVILGNGISFNSNEILIAPPSINGQGVVTSFNLFDINNDGSKELIIGKTGDGKDSFDNFYENWSIQILEVNSNNLVDNTDTYIDIYSGTSRWFPWMDITEKDSKIQLVNSLSKDTGSYLEWELVSGKFIKK